MSIRLAAVAALFAVPALAHVTLENPVAPANATYKAVLRIPHGCGDADTIRVTVSLPEGARDAQPMVKPGWSIRTAPGQVIFENGVLPAAYYDEFALRFRTPDRAGDTLRLPVVQDCTGGKTAAWTGTEPRMPAPELRLVQAQATAPAEAAAGALRISQPWSRATARAGATGAGFLTIRNTSDQPDRLVGASSPIAPTVELHTHTHVNGVMQMRPVPAIDIPPNGEVTLKPGSLHIMLIGTKEALRQGTTVPLTLRFERAGEVTVALSVQGPGAAQPGSGGGHGH